MVGVSVSIAIALARNEVANDVAAYLADVADVNVDSLDIKAVTGAGPVLTLGTGSLGSTLTTAASQGADVSSSGGLTVSTRNALKSALSALALSDTLAVTVLAQGTEWALRDVASGRSWVIRKTATGYDVVATSIDAVTVAASLAAGIGLVGVAISGAGALAVNTVTSTTNAYAARSSLTSGGTVALTADSSAAILATVVAVSVALGGGIAGVAVSIGVAIARNLIGYDAGDGTAADHVVSTGLTGGATIVTGDTVLVDEGPLSGKVFQYVGTPAVSSYAGVDFTDPTLWREVRTRNAAQVRAYLLDTSVDATGALTLQATGRQTIAAIVVAGSAAVAGGVVGVGGAGAGASTENRIAVDVAAFIAGDGVAGIDDIITASAVSLAATDTSTIKVDVGAVAIAGGVGGVAGAVSIAVALATNTIDDHVEAFVSDASVEAEAGALTVSAIEAASIESLTVAAAISAAIGAISLTISGAGAIAENVILSAVRSYAADADLGATGAVAVTAGNTARILATIAVLSASVSGGVLGGGALAIGAAIARNILGWDYTSTTASGTKTMLYGDKVRLADGYAGGGTPGAVYRYLGTNASRNLGTQDYSNTALWVEEGPNQVKAYLDDTSVDAGGALTVSASDTSSINALVAAGSVAAAASFGFALAGAGAGAQATNRIASQVWAYIDGDGATGISASSVSVTATSTTSITATTGAVAVALSIAPLGAALAVAVAAGHQRDRYRHRRVPPQHRHRPGGHRRWRHRCGDHPVARAVHPVLGAADQGPAERRCHQHPHHAEQPLRRSGRVALGGRPPRPDHGGHRRGLAPGRHPRRPGVPAALGGRDAAGLPRHDQRLHRGRRGGGRPRLVHGRRDQGRQHHHLPDAGVHRCRLGHRTRRRERDRARHLQHRRGAAHRVGRRRLRGRRRG